MRYRKKPVVIEAFCFTKEPAPQWFIDALKNGGVTVANIKGDTTVIIPTLEGTMSGKNGDWIIKGVKGELYPCKPDIFEATYEAEDTVHSRPIGFGQE